MKAVCIGAGPAGLYFAISMMLRDSRNEVCVIERNKAVPFNVLLLEIKINQER